MSTNFVCCFGNSEKSIGTEKLFDSIETHMCVPSNAGIVWIRQKLICENKFNWSISN